MGRTKIEWTDGGKTWNPIKARLRESLTIIGQSLEERYVPAGKVGYHCERISAGCCKCYACTGNKRTLPAWGTGLDYTVPNREKVEIFLDAKVLLEPLRWKKPTKIFPCSMTDWAADFVPDEMMDQMLAVAALTPWHTYQFLTKRAERLPRYFDPPLFRDLNVAANAKYLHTRVSPFRLPSESIFKARSVALGRPWEIHAWPLPNVQLGFSAEDQPNFDARWEHMRELAAAGWFVWASLEPLLGPIDCVDALETWRDHGEVLRWAVAGGESGAGARPNNLRWTHRLIEQFASGGVPLFVKQAGSKPFLPSCADVACTHPDCDPGWLKLKDKKGGSLEEWPEWMRVREFPNLKGATA